MRDRHFCCAVGRITTMRSTAVQPTATGTILIIRTTTWVFAWLLRRGEHSSTPESAQGIASSVQGESRPVPATAATLSEYTTTAGGLVGASRRPACVFLCAGIPWDRRHPGGSRALPDADVSRPFRTGVVLARYERDRSASGNAR
ncbi:hypothetical protein U14_03854 [Candidatus Moduliflexus flocculans]|uniref:Uncharacterized protein n=1 Tax=Candidatus Moduliflexus flocculans TaxID=1499966 RepID=A0A081BQD6_9BACT|nr:hypothetical protein U14_03854 [Candidatus Moduliflexus flocculans]